MDLHPTLSATSSTRSKTRKSASKSSKTQDNPFIIITTPSTKIDAVARKQIRSHVMLGKNRKRDDPKRNVTLGSWINDSQIFSPTATPISIPNRVGTDFSHIPLAEILDPYRAKLVSTWFTTLKTSMYPVETIVQPPMDQWLDYLAHDRAYLACVLFAAQAFLDWARDRKIGKLSLQHLNSAMHNLRQTLAESSQTPTDSTLAVVVTLSMMSDVMQDYDAAKKHVEGLYQLIQMRGGIRTLQYNPQLQVKVLRADLGHAISTGSKPLFFSEGFSWDPYLANHNKTPKSTSPAAKRTILSILSASNEVPDQRLINIYLDLQEFTLATNIAYQTASKIAFEPFLETLVSAQYRLLALLNEHSESETTMTMMLILGMLTFTTTTFLQVRNLPMRYMDLTRRLRKLLSTISQRDQKEDDAVTKYKLWLVFIAAISIVTDPEDESLFISAATPLLVKLGMVDASWNNVRGALREFLWVDWLQSAFGRSFHARVMGYGKLL
ncbi:hypothetical protein QBC38DRAFT_476161 [Podospora fimiseda]|uniref:Tachykinin family protein n=1 Tax=Podospora fimiseda TaxID=252190 RepID=A0AAN7BR98_9PEZI|nr:hypothetical protein QBC38DRAFT_476161 [Podospora fimiseda]